MLSQLLRLDSTEQRQQITLHELIIRLLFAMKMSTVMATGEIITHKQQQPKSPIIACC